MSKLGKVFSGQYWEFILQAIFFSLVFIFSSFDRRDPSIHAYQVVFFLNYAIAVLILSYFLFPKYLYEKKYW